MTRRKPFACALIAAGALTTVAAAPATAATKAPKKATLSAVGGMEFKANRHVADTMRFDRDRVTIRSGGTLTVRDRTGAPHTVSLVKRRDQPRSFAQMEKCFQGGKCAELAAAHGVTEENQEPTNPLVNAGAAGFDVAGDSALFTRQQPLKAKITAAAGTNLHYICLIHPWMQGRISVR